MDIGAVKNHQEGKKHSELAKSATIAAVSVARFVGTEASGTGEVGGSGDHTLSVISDDGPSTTTSPGDSTGPAA